MSSSLAPSPGNTRLFLLYQSSRVGSWLSRFPPVTVLVSDHVRQNVRSVHRGLTRLVVFCGICFSVFFWEELAIICVPCVPSVCRLCATALVHVGTLLTMADGRFLAGPQAKLLRSKHLTCTEHMCTEHGHCTALNTLLLSPCTVVDLGGGLACACSITMPCS